MYLCFGFPGGGGGLWDYVSFHSTAFGAIGILMIHTISSASVSHLTYVLTFQHSLGPNCVCVCAFTEFLLFQIHALPEVHNTECYNRFSASSAR